VVRSAWPDDIFMVIVPFVFSLYCTIGVGWHTAAAAAAAAVQQQGDAEKMAAATRLATSSLHHRKEEGVARRIGMPLISKESEEQLRQREITAVVVLNENHKKYKIQKQIS
jgi:hypothetical protein